MSSQVSGSGQKIIDKKKRRSRSHSADGSANRTRTVIAQRVQSHTDGNECGTATCAAPPAPAPLTNAPLPSIQFVIPSALTTNTNGCTDVYSKEENAYLAKLTEEERVQLLLHMKDEKETRVPLLFQVAQSNLPNKADILSKLRSRTEGAKFDNYVSNALKIPIGIYDPLPVSDGVGTFLRHARKIMDAEIYGQDKLKDQTVRALCSWATNPSNSGITLALEGPPGVGKTNYARAIGKIMQRPTFFISLGGMNDVAVIIGHSYSYESAIYGQLAQALIESKSSSPVIVFDEVDKLGESYRAQEIVALLIHLTDPNCNTAIRDRYFHDIPLDFSRVCFIFTMNDKRRVSPILLDRLSIVQMTPPTVSDKVAIASTFLIPRELERIRADIEFEHDAVYDLVKAHSSRESGVRNLARSIREIVETLNVVRRGGEDVLRAISLPTCTLTSNTKVSTHMVESIMGKPCTAHDGVSHSMMYM